MNELAEQADIPVGSFFDRLGSPYVAASPGVWESALRVALPDGKELTFPLLVVQLTDDFDDRYVRLLIAPYGDDSVSDGAEPRHPDLARLNEQLLGVKFGIDSDGDVSLMLDAPAEGLDATAFAAALRRLALYAGACWNEFRHGAVDAHAGEAGRDS